MNVASSYPPPKPFAHACGPILPPAEIAKVCTCCRKEHTWPAWLMLSDIGLQDDGDGGFLRLRNCGCGSTLGVEQADEATARMFLFLGGQ